MQNAELPKWLEVRDIAKSLGLGRESARQLIVTGKLKARRPSGNPRGKYQVAEAEFVRYQAETEAAA